MKIWKIALFALIAVATSCGTYQQQPKIKITHVLAVTEQNDTLRLPINMIRPNVYYNVISYPNSYYSNWSYGKYYPNHYNYKYIYTPSNKGTRGSGGSTSSSKIKVAPSSNNNKPSGEKLLKTKN